MRRHLVAVDIGTASARAGVFDEDGTQISKAAYPIAMLRPHPGQAEHDSEDIWQAICKSVRAALESAGKTAADIAGIGFDATCSLVIRGHDIGRAALSREGDKVFDTLSWLDHRAGREAKALSGLNQSHAERAGGAFSPEMALPKLLWLKLNRPDLWQGQAQVFDLSDYATSRASGSTARSVSPLTAKWNYSPDKETGWDLDYLEKAGLDDLRSGTGVPERGTAIGQSLGTLTAPAARELGLNTQCHVAPGLVDAYAGVLGLLGCLDGDDLSGNLALIAGTSSCLAWLAPLEPQPMPAFWGPFRDVVVPGLWLMEGGQSAAGALLDHMVRMHAAGGEADAALHARIIARISQLKAREGEAFGHPIDVLPDFHGNRSPIGDPTAWGIVTGLSLDNSFDGLCRLYWRTAVGIACGIRHILEKVEEGSGIVSTIHIAGGHARNPLLVALYSDMTGRPVAVTQGVDPVLLGSAVNAAVSAGLYGTLKEAACAMAPERIIHHPDPVRRQLFERDYQRHLLLIRQRAELQALYGEG